MTGVPVTGHSWTVEVEPTCVGSGLCAVTAPRHFRLVTGYGDPIHTEVEAGQDAVLAAAELCPMGAILVRDGRTGHPVLDQDRRATRAGPA